MTKLQALGGLLLGLCCACSPSTEEKEGSITPRMIGPNGFSINGFSINGFSINGFSINGFSINGFSINGSELAGVLLDPVNGPTPISDTELIGMEIDFIRHWVDGQGVAHDDPYKLRIDDAFLDPTAVTDDVHAYMFSFYDSTTSTWKPTCQDPQGNAVPAIPIADAYWDMTTGDRIDQPGAITLACRNAALGKCVAWGYRPWGTATQCEDGVCDEVSLVDTHQACTRMVRADYCGTGHSYTVNGTMIDIYDQFSPQIQTRSANWPFEGVWDPDGVVCMGQARHAELIAAFPLECALPVCAVSMPALDGDGGSPPASGFFGLPPGVISTVNPVTEPGGGEGGGHLPMP